MFKSTCRAIAVFLIAMFFSIWLSADRALAVQDSVPVWGLDFSSDGNWLATGGGERGSQGWIQVWNTQNWKERFSLDHTSAITCLAFSPDGNRLVAGTQKGQLLLIDSTSGEVTAQWDSDKWAVFGVSWTPDGEKVLGACANGAIKIWDAQTYEQLMTLDIWQADGIDDPGRRGHSDRNIWNLAVTKDGKTLISVGWNDTTRVWELEGGALLQSFSTTDQSPQGVQLTADEKYAMTIGINNQIRIRQWPSMEDFLIIPLTGRDIAVDVRSQWVAAGTSSNVQVIRVPLSGPSTEKDVELAQQCIEQLGSDNSEVRDRAVQMLESIGPGVVLMLHEAFENMPERTQEALSELLQ